MCDVSVIAAWAFEEESTDHTEAALERAKDAAIFVPGVFPFELANAMAVAVKRKRLEVDEARGFLIRIEELDIREIAPKDPALALFDASRRYGLTAYDAAYVSLAAESGLELATQDVAMREAAPLFGVSLTS